MNPADSSDVTHVTSKWTDRPSIDAIGTNREGVGWRLATTNNQTHGRPEFFLESGQNLQIAMFQAD